MSNMLFGKDDGAPQEHAIDGILLGDLPFGQYLGEVSGWTKICGQTPDDLVITDRDADPVERENAGRIFVLFSVLDLE